MIYRKGDSIVSFEDAQKWAEELIPMRPEELEGHLMELEPAVLGLASQWADRVKMILLEARVDPRVIERVARYVTHGGAMCCEVTRRGYGKFLADLLEPDHEDDKEARDE